MVRVTVVRVTAGCLTKPNLTLTLTLALTLTLTLTLTLALALALSLTLTRSRGSVRRSTHRRATSRAWCVSGSLGSKLH